MGLTSENIKYLRKLNNLTQEDLAKKIGIKRSLIGAYEEGRANPRISSLIKMAEVFKVTVDMIINRELRKFSQEEIEVMKPGEGKLKVLSITVDEENRENIDLVPQKAAAGYLNGYADPEYIRDLPKFRLPILPDNATYRAFEISGDSMLPLESGTIVIGKYLEDLEELKNGKNYILVTSREGVVFKRVFNYLKEKGKLFLVSDNKTYAPYEIPAEEIIEIWEAKAYISINFPDPEDAKNLSLTDLTDLVMELKQEVRKLKGK